MNVIPTPNLLELLLIGFLAVYRLTLLVVDESGPFDLFGRLRHWAGIRYDEHSRKIATNPLAEMLTCFFCTSVWVGLAVFAIIVASFRVESLWLALVPFALSGGATFMKKWAG